MVRLKFRHRVGLLVLLAALALMAVTAVMLVLGTRTETQLTGIETRYVPLIEIDRDLNRIAAAVGKTVEDAASAGEQAELAEADRLEAEFLARLADGKQVILDNGADPDALAAAFTTYYASARELSAAMIGGAEAAQLTSKIESMRVARRDFTAQLAVATSPNRARLAAAFATARASQREALSIDIVVASAALLLMAFLSWRMIRRTVRSLGAVSDGVQRLASGDFAQEIVVPSGDEIADLAREANATAARLREYRDGAEREMWIQSGLAELLERISGELAVETLGSRALHLLLTYLDAECGAIYAGEGDAFRLLSAENVADRERVPASFPRADEGALAKAAVDREIRLVTDGTLGYLAKATASAVIIVPLDHEGQTMGVLALSVTKPAREKVIELLVRARSQIGVALRVAESREQTRALLAETQRQALAAQTANKELEAFSYSVSHDLRGPLRAIDGFSQALLEDEGDKLSPHGHDYLRRTRAAAQRMAELIDDLLRLSRVSRSDFKKERMDLSSMANVVVAELRKAQPDRSVKLVIQDNMTALADARLMRITLENLIGNAWKFTSKTTDAAIEIGTRHEGGETIYFVRDNGAGFDMQYVDRLFGAFQRLHTDKDFPGTGIGLATVQRIVQRHGGRIWVDASPGSGATFQFTLPTK